MALTEPLAFLLQREGSEVRTAADGREAPAEFSKVEPDVVLLNLTLPGMSDTEVCKNIRLESSAPVIMATVRDTEINKIIGFEIGTDSYVTKPYSSREFIARIRAVLRHGRHDDFDDVKDLYEEVLCDDPVVLGIKRYVVTVGGDDAAMSLKEFDLLEYLLHNRGRALARGQFIDRVWGSDYVGGTKTLDVYIKRLRLEVGRNPSPPEFLVTVRGLGYKLEDQRNRLLPTISAGDLMELRRQTLSGASPSATTRVAG